MAGIGIFDVDLGCGAAPTTRNLDLFAFSSAGGGATLAPRVTLELTGHLTKFLNMFASDYCNFRVLGRGLHEDEHVEADAFAECEPTQRLRMSALVTALPEPTRSGLHR